MSVDRRNREIIREARERQIRIVDTYDKIIELLLQKQKEMKTK